MGYGDWIIASGQVRELYEKRKLPVLVVGRNNKPQWSEIFHFNPKVVRSPAVSCQILVNGSGIRPYIETKTETKWTWKKFKPPRGEIFLSESERILGTQYAGRVLIEPTVKTNSHSNKAWVADRWQKLVDSMPEVSFVQCGPDQRVRLRGVTFVRTGTFREACAVLAFSRAFVGTEGGLMHAAAAFRIPSVILWSEFIAPSVTGYEDHRNIRHAGEPCGMRVDCARCRESMLAISVEEVRANLTEVLQKS